MKAKLLKWENYDAVAEAICLNYKYIYRPTMSVDGELSVLLMVYTAFPFDNGYCGDITRKTKALGTYYTVEDARTAAQADLTKRLLEHLE